MEECWIQEISRDHPLHSRDFSPFFRYRKRGNMVADFYEETLFDMLITMSGSDER